MKEIKAFIKPIKLENVVEALKENGFESVTLSECEGTGTYKREDSLPSLKFHFADSKMIKLELVCQNEEAEQACQLICKNAATPYPADGIIYVSDINDAYRIKTGKSIKRFNI
ncbi:nitrogen regulatory protein P-II family [Lutibacter oceani]|uniref:Nitrogen regulatory protein P-II family n=1 Tax=Lutibacter oceani TaxID=1853311 RepID=A0A3D9RS16_9FLAO|nr:P-II family nitrogen regulator [Lutibacter oceani]REE80304.1 nitrogen regulatory protein P-II family [Lutibacter oceani]